MTDERGLSTTNLYDTLDRLTNSANPLGAVFYAYNKLDLVKATDRMGFTTSFGYDSLRRRIAETNALGNYTLYNYCTCGALDSIQDAAGNYTLFSYDNAGWRIETDYPDGYSITNYYDLLGRATNVVDSANRSVTNWFNNQGQLYAVQDAAGYTSFLGFDDEDRVTNSYDVNGVSTVMTYDNLGRLLTRSYPDGGTEYFGYSARGLVAYTNQLNLTNGYAYDAAGRKTAETNANGEATLFGYSPAGDLLSLTDGKNQTTTWGYDPFGQVTNKLDQTSAVIFTYAYDSDNRLTHRWTPAKGTTVYKYDPVGNLTNISYPVSGMVEFAYDTLNRLTDMVDGLGTTHYTYDAAGQLLTEGGLFDSDTVTNTYSNRRRVALALQQSAGVWTNAFGWDATGRLSGVASAAGTFTYSYSTLVGNCSGRLVHSLVLPNGAIITNAYDPVARVLATVLDSSSGGTLDAALYGYNAGNERTGYTNAAGTYVHYTYDPIGQLKAGTSSISSENRGYAYDAAWNLTGRTNGGTSTYAYPVDAKNEVTNDLLGVISYDANGNLVSRGTGLGTATLCYDDENRLIYFGNSASTPLSCGGVPASKGTATAQFFYDGLGRLRKRIDYTGVNRTETHYIYDGMRVIQERDGGNVPTTGYTRGLDLSGSLEGAGGIGGLLARSTQFYYCTNNTFLTVAITNPTSLEIAFWIYDDTETFVADAGIGAGDAQSFTFPAVAGVEYTVDAYYGPYLLFRDTFIPTLVEHDIEVTEDYECSTSNSGSVLCGPGPNWLRHDFYFADGNGNITCLLNTNQAVSASYRYDPYGNTLSQSGPMADANVYRFSSKEILVNSGFYYYGYRFYDPSLQRWINRDPLGEWGGVNLYGFADEDAIDLIDRDGADVVKMPPTPPTSQPARPLPPRPPPTRPLPRPLPKTPPVPKPPPVVIRPTLVPTCVVGPAAFCLALSPMSSGPEPVMGPNGWIYPEGWCAPRLPDLENCPLEDEHDMGPVAGYRCEYWCRKSGARPVIYVPHSEGGCPKYIRR